MPVGSEVDDPAVKEGKVQVRTPDEWVDACVAVILLLMASPLLMISAFLVKLAHGGRVFWSGERLGQHRKPFTMYKIHTLKDSAESLLGEHELTEMTANSLGLELHFGHFLRETHLDELPQLLNVIRGDMRIIGPRPLRRAVYEDQCRHIPEFDRRFEVKPGVIGYSQVLSTHNSHKRISKKLDNRFIRNPPRPAKRAVFVCWVLLVLTGKMVVKAARLIARLGKTERRMLQRSRHHHTSISVFNGSDCRGVLKELSAEVLAVRLNRKLPNADARMLLETRVFDWASFRWKRKIAYCRTEVLGSRNITDSEHPHAYILKYEAESPLNHYRIEKYYLRRSAL
jgi:lipopolysaccharide/colanic/teichoic acid biosynthesis glycosyltransferase